MDIPALQAKGLSPVDVINAISTQNLVLPSGTVKLGSTEFNVEMNGSPDTLAALNNLPISTMNGATIYVQRRRLRQRRFLAADQHCAHGRTARRDHGDLQNRRNAPLSTSFRRSTPSCR